MQNEVVYAANSEALVERGYNFLITEEFDRAYDYFNRALDIDAKLHMAYWGMLLAERQSQTADGADLIKVGICIDNDPNYRFACQYADEDNRKKYEKISLLCSYMCHIILMKLIYERKRLPALLRAKHYAQSSIADQQLVKAHASLLRDNAMTEFTYETPSFLISLLEIYQNDEAFSEYDRKLHFSEIVKDLYKSFMDRLLQEIVICKTPIEIAKAQFFEKYNIKKEKNTGTLPNIAYDGEFYALYGNPSYRKDLQNLNALVFAEWQYEAGIDVMAGGAQKAPTKQEQFAQLWVKPCEKSSIFIGSDGKPSNVGDRWRYLAKYLHATEGAKASRAYAVMILDFYDKAVECGADFDLCQHEKQAFFDAIVSKMTSSAAIRSIRNTVPDKRRADCRIIELVLNEQEHSVGELMKEADEKYKDVEYLINRHRRIPKKDAEWMQCMISKSITELEEKTERIQETLNDNRKETDKCLLTLSETISTDDEEYKKWLKEANRIHEKVAGELKRYKDYILQLRKYYAALSDRSRNPFVRHIELIPEGES